MTRRSPRPALLLGGLLALAACGGRAPATDSSAAGVDTVQAAAGDTAAVPADLPGLVGQIRSGIAPLAARVGNDPDGTRQRAVDLYITRQEELERRYGPRSDPGATASALGRSVIDAETRFHELMQLLSKSPPPDSAAVAGAVAALDDEYGTVLAEADSAGVR